MKRKKLNKPLSLFVLLLIYALAFMVGFWSVLELKITSPLWQMVYANLIATLIIYFFSKLMDNSSVYDPYWSVAPVVTTFFWLLPQIFTKSVSVYQWIGLALVFIWGFRLTLNWMLRWKGFQDEDWRYVAIRNKTKNWYWPVSLLGIHLFPTLLVFLGILPLYFVFSHNQTPHLALFYVAVVIIVIAIGLESVADFQLLKFRDTGKNKNKRLRSGLWKTFSHPNYTGEILFWWGVYLYAVAFYLPLWRLFLGPGLITILFYFVSIPMMDAHLNNKR
jgi:steroid 5-alpha reductase family enzyme